VILGWQGFAFEHPDDWSLSRVNGNRSRGFLMLTSSGAVTAQIRWEPKGSPRVAVNRYLDSLVAKKLATRINIDDYSDSEIEWKRTGDTHGRGFATILDDGRLALYEVSGRAGDQLLPKMRQAKDSLAVTCLWSVIGLAVHIPERFVLSDSRFLSGRCRLDFRYRGHHLVATRLGLAAQLMAEEAIERIAGRSVTEVGPNRYEAEMKSVLGRNRLLLLHEPDLNQFVILHGSGRRLELLPEWEWFDAIKKSSPS